jgi:hypothetical protein
VAQPAPGRPGVNWHDRRAVAQFGRALVSKTSGRGFESLPPCQGKHDIVPAQLGNLCRGLLKAVGVPALELLVPESSHN